MENAGKRRCLLDENKICDDCGECDRCDLDPTKICDNCCKCIAMEDADSEFRTVTLDGKNGFVPDVKTDRKKAQKPAEPTYKSPDEEPYELTPELVAYWESKLAEYGEAPADDGFGEIEVNERIPVKGVRKISPHRGNKHRHG